MADRLMYGLLETNERTKGLFGVETEVARFTRTHSFLTLELQIGRIKF